MCYDLVTTPNHGKEVFLINSIAQESRYRLSVLQYANRYSVMQIARVYRCNHQFSSSTSFAGAIMVRPNLCFLNRCPHSHPRHYTPDEIALICRMRHRNPYDGLIVFWVKLYQKGYQRTPL